MRSKMTKEEKKKVDAELMNIQNREYSQDDVEKVIKNESRIKTLFNKAALKEYANYAPVLISMIKDYASKKYKEIPTGTIVGIVGALLYVFLPVDVIPDVLPVIGFTDDAAVVAWCIGRFAGDLNKYKKWKDSQELVEINDETSGKIE